MFLEKINNFCCKTAIYPPVALFGAINNPTQQEKKAEQRIINVCEDLYKIDNQTLNNLRVCYQQAALCELFNKNLKDSYLIKSCATLAATLKFSHKALENMHKKDPILTKYFSDIKLEKEDFNLTWNYVSLNLKETSIEKAAIEFKEISSKVEQNLKENK